MANDNHEAIDWATLEAEVTRRGQWPAGSEGAKLAIQLIIGEDRLRGVVDYYVDRFPFDGAELARHALWQLHPRSSMQRCYEIYKSDPDIERRRTAVELLRVVADGSVLAWIPEFLSDPDPGIQNWGIGVLDQLLFGGGLSPDGSIPNDAETVLILAECHSSEYVQEHAASIRSFLKERRLQSKEWENKLAREKGPGDS